MTNLGNVSIYTTIAANSVALGTDTTGNYVAGVTAGTGIAIVNGAAGLEGASQTISIDLEGKPSLSEYIADTVGNMVSSNTESGISVLYDDADNTLDFDVNDFTITLAGDLSGSATITNLANVTLTATIAADSVALGTDTTGNYVAGITAGAGITVSGSGAETANVTVAVDATNATFIEDIQDIVGNMVSTNTESGISVVYDDATGKLNFDVADPTITLAGDLTGSATITNLGNVTLTATIAADSVALGTDTTGNYVAGITAGTGTVYESSVAESGNVVITRVILDLTGLDSSGSAGDIIGDAAGGGHLPGHRTRHRHGTAHPHRLADGKARPARPPQCRGQSGGHRRTASS
jgi:hypothetical protein